MAQLSHGATKSATKTHFKDENKTLRIHLEARKFLLYNAVRHM